MSGFVIEEFGDVVDFVSDSWRRVVLAVSCFPQLREPVLFSGQLPG